MAESAVEILMKTITLLLEENDPGLMSGGVRHEISKVKLELESMRSFLKDAEKYTDHNASLCAWVAQVREVAFKAEDVIDEYLYHFGNKGESGLRASLRGALIFPMKLWLRHKTAHKLKEIKGEIKDIAKRSKRYDLSHIGGGSSSHHTLDYAQNVGESSFFLDSSEVVGIEKQREALLEMLTGGQMRRTVITLVGMGGSGKTTLAASAFNHPAVKRSFGCCGWVSVSQNYTIENILRKMITEFFDGMEKLVPPSLDTMVYKNLVEILVHFLHDRKYLIVLDDVWNSNLWRQVSVALPDNKNRSRVIITTRKEDIAGYPYGPGSQVLHSHPLSNFNAWTLFCAKAFCNEPNSCCPPELEQIASALVEKCEGLPLAIVALGGLMATKDKSELKWKEVYDSLSWHVRNNSMLDEVKTILLLSFKELPFYLKNCFLYCCRFPGGHSIGAGRLIRMWMAEGFLEERKDLTPEEVGKIYLKELISRSLIQVQRHNTFLRPKTCKLHDLVWELAFSVSEKDHFLAWCNLQEMQAEDQHRARRISVLTVHTALQLPPEMKHVKSFSVFNFEENSPFPLHELLLGFKLIRVLELRDAPVDYLPKRIGRLFNLRYLGLRGTGVKELPKSVGRLKKLQTLDVRRTNMISLPDEISKLHDLRHLLTYSGSANEQFDYIVGVEVPATIWRLKNLQVINCITADDDLVKGIGKMTQLKRIELTNVKEEHGPDLCSSIEKLQCLHHLLIMASDESEILRIDNLLSSPPNFRKLTLIGRLSNVPKWFPLMRNIIHLHLHWSRLMEDPIPYVCKLPNLERLALVNAYGPEKKQLCFNEGFSKLEVLYLAMLPELVEITIFPGVMPSLERLSLHGCTKLRNVPLGIENLLNLKVLDLKDASAELVQHLREEESVDRLKVSHVPVIKHFFEEASERGYEKLS